jgi:hypothetical protein
MVAIVFVAFVMFWMALVLPRTFTYLVLVPTISLIWGVFLWALCGLATDLPVWDPLVVIKFVGACIVIIGYLTHRFDLAK